MNIRRKMIIFKVLIFLIIITSASSSFKRSSLDNLEKIRWQEVIDELKHQKISLKVFYHASKWKQYWKEVIQEHLSLLDGKRTPYTVSSQYPYGIDSIQYDVNNETGSAGYYWVKNKRFVSVLDYANDMLINVGDQQRKAMNDVENAVKEMNLTNISKIKFNFNQTIPREQFRKSSHEIQKQLLQKNNLTEGEVSTIDLLHKYCINEKKNNRRSFVLYLHSKGGCCVRRGSSRFTPKPVAAWRESMNTFTIEYPSICVRSLLSKYSACGYNSKDASFSGNFFWADCDHVAMLPSIMSSPFDAWGAEFFIFNISTSYTIRTFYGAHCAYNTLNCNDDHYKKECSKLNYTSRLQEYLDNKTLPPNTGPLIVKNNYKDIAKEEHFNVSFCASLRNQKKFEEANFFTKPSIFINLTKNYHSDGNYFYHWRDALRHSIQKGET